MIRVSAQPRVQLQTGGAVSPALTGRPVGRNRSLLRCFYAGALDAVCPVPLVDFYLGGVHSSFGSPVRGDSNTRRPVPLLGPEATTLPCSLPGPVWLRVESGRDFSGILESVRNSEREAGAQERHGSGCFRDRVPSLSPGSTAGNQLVGASELDLWYFD